MVEILAQKIEIDPDSFVGDKSLLEPFICCVCLLVAQEPVQCPNCETIFCKSCVDKANKCPNRCEIPNFKKLNRNLKLILEKFEFECKKCTENFSYIPFS